MRLCRHVGKSERSLKSSDKREVLTRPIGAAGLHGRFDGVVCVIRS